MPMYARAGRHKESHRINRLPGRRTSNKACNPQPPPSSRYQTQVWGADAKKEVRRKLVRLDEGVLSEGFWLKPDALLQFAQTPPPLLLRSIFTSSLPGMKSNPRHPFPSILSFRLNYNLSKKCCKLLGKMIFDVRQTECNEYFLLGQLWQFRW